MRRPPVAFVATTTVTVAVVAAVVSAKSSWRLVGSNIQQPGLTVVRGSMGPSGGYMVNC
ncbi:MAG: hypothetical protein INR71_12870 [Terriglobus roseus]|nr:hypothetical protein [Terriglobus roseus]